ncbi:DNA (cytosine-5-)-methyltransferase, partial [Patescibacteria group bacterium]|nr:DNA (cytosine-5-)-methyltransferase [Patescibacteria group bacterium]
MIFRFGELFCGPGGLAWAAKNASFSSHDEQYSIQHAWATDYDRDTCDTYRSNICPDAPETVVCKDIRKLDYDKLNKISNVDAIAFGFPCNDFSVVGEQKGINGVYGPLYSYGVKALAKFKPKWFLAENVGGLRNANEGGTFKKILQDLFDEGYSVYPHLYKFEQYGVPQARHRIIIVGIRKDLDVLFKIPSSKTFSMKTCREAIEEPPIDKNANNNEYTKQSKTVVERLKFIKPGENAFTADIPEHLQLNVKG